MRTRNNMIKVMLNDKELEHLNKQLKTSGLYKSTLLRKLIMELKINPAPVDEYSKICTLLSNATNNLNQIARHANTTGYISEDKLDAAILLIRKCWQEIRVLR
ncbi:MAG: plasmid mobilization relaxosome protein MobC [Clostridiales bacterium]|nr:plasmid mobilization relaxosome protein MobC [Clostridiales bacterium]